MTDLTEQDICIGSLGQQKVYLNWSDVKDICTKEVSTTYEQTKRENAQLKELLKRVVNVTDFYHEINTASVVDHGVWYNIANEINQALGEDK